jgi:glycerophosphoryl diester phosphodiesterase
LRAAQAEQRMSVLDIAMRVADTVVGAVPRPQPSRAALERCRIISHRGEHGNRSVPENTLQAFSAAAEAGVWGIECDLRWTADGVPVICHDADLARVFGIRERLADLRFDALRARCPLVPTLEEVLQRFGGERHLMLELKAERWPRAARQTQTLAALLADFEPGRDYHLLSLQADMFARTDFVPPRACLPVAETNVGYMSRIALERGYAGIGGHYLLLGESLRRRHAAAGQRIGTGFPASGNCLRRELNRGVEWVFSNHAVALQGLRDRWLNDAPPQIAD